MNEKRAEGVNAELRDVLSPLLIRSLSDSTSLKEYDERMEEIAKEVYPEVSLLQQGFRNADRADLYPDD